MKIGDLVLYQGRSYVLRGLDPMGVSDQHAYLQGAETGERIAVPLEEVEAAEGEGEGLTEGQQ